MQMVYDVAAKELKPMQLNDVHPQDYLNFYCLASFLSCYIWPPSLSLMQNKFERHIYKLRTQ